MRTRFCLALFGLAALAGCGSEAPDTAVEAHEQRADNLENAAEVSNPAGAAQLENLAEQHERAAERLEETSRVEPAPGNIVGAPIPDNVSVGVAGQNSQR